MDRMINVGIIGCGGIANAKHMPALSKLENVRMVAFCDLDIARAQKAAKQFGTPDAKVYTDYKELIKDPDIEAVHVCTPNRSHAPITVDSLYAGKHVMCEKPMAKTAAEAAAMVEAAKQTGKKLSIGYQHRQKVQATVAKQYIDDGVLGEIYHAECLAVRRRGTPNWGVFLNEEEQGGGPIIDIATHSLDLTLALMNNYEPHIVLGKTHKKLEHPEDGNPWGDQGVSESTLEDSACAMIVMKNGATILLTTSWAINTAEPCDAASCVLYGSKAGLYIKRDKLVLNKVEHGRMVDIDVNCNKGGVDFYSGNGKKPSDYEAENWIKCILEDTEPVVKPEQAYTVSKILEAIYTSSRTGQPVYFD